MHSIIGTIENFIVQWGYWAVFFGLLMENAGIPVPGETILILASVVSFKHHHELRLGWIIVVGTIAATTGDNIGYWIGRKGGRWLLDRWKHFFHVSDRHVQSAEQLIEKHGAKAVFVARFVTGARIVAGPIAGVLRMQWARFALFNFLGAVTWVTVIAVIAHLFGSQLDLLLNYFARANYLILVLLAVVIAVIWWRARRR